MSYQTNGPLILFGSVHCEQDQHKSYQCSCQIPLIVSVRLILVMRLIKTCSSCLLDWEHMKYFENDALTTPARWNGYENGLAMLENNVQHSGALRHILWNKMNITSPGALPRAQRRNFQQIIPKLNICLSNSPAIVICLLRQEFKNVTLIGKLTKNV